MNETEKYSVVYSPEAKDDLREIFIYIAGNLQEPQIAEKQIARIRKGIRSLDVMPYRYTAVDWEPWKSMKMHRLFVDNFLVYYAVSEDNRTVTVIRIFYGKRDVKGIITE